MVSTKTTARTGRKPGGTTLVKNASTSACIWSCAVGEACSRPIVLPRIIDSPGFQRKRAPCEYGIPATLTPLSP